MERHSVEFLKDTLRPLVEKFKVRLAYFFGSQLKGEIGEMSDVDIAVLWGEEERTPMLRSLLLQREIKDLLNTERVEVGPLNNQDLSFCYDVISEGRCIFGEEVDRVEYETDILNEYLDFQFLAEHYNRAFLQKMSE